MLLGAQAGSHWAGRFLTSGLFHQVLQSQLIVSAFWWFSQRKFYKQSDLQTPFLFHSNLLEKLPLIVRPHQKHLYKRGKLSFCPECGNLLILHDKEETFVMGQQKFWTAQSSPLNQVLQPSIHLPFPYTKGTAVLRAMVNLHFSSSYCCHWLHFQKH